MKRIVSLIGALAMLGQAMGCATLVPDLVPGVAQRSSSPQNCPERILHRNQNASLVAESRPPQLESLPPVVSVQQNCKARVHESLLRPVEPLRLVEPCNMVSQEVANSRRIRDRAFAAASQKAIHQLNEQRIKTSAKIRHEPNTCPSVVESDSNHPPSTESVSHLSAAANENDHRKPTAGLLPPTLKSSPFLILTISALVLSGATWPLARRQHRSPLKVLEVSRSVRPDPMNLYLPTNTREISVITVAPHGFGRHAIEVPSRCFHTVTMDWEIDSDLEQVTVLPHAHGMGLPLYQKRITHRTQHHLVLTGAPSDMQRITEFPADSRAIQHLPATTWGRLTSRNPIVGFVVLLHEQDGADCAPQVFTVETIVKGDDGRLFAKIGSPVRSAARHST